MDQPSYSESEVTKIIRLAERMTVDDRISRDDLLRAAGELGLSPDLIAKAEREIAKEHLDRRDRAIFARHLRSEQKGLSASFFKRSLGMAGIYFWLTTVVGVKLNSEEVVLAFFLPALLFVFYPALAVAAQLAIPKVRESAFSRWRSERHQPVPRDMDKWFDYYFAVHDPVESPHDIEDQVQRAYGLTPGEAFAAVKSYYTRTGRDYFSNLRDLEDGKAMDLIERSTKPSPADEKSLDRFQQDLP